MTESVDPPVDLRVSVGSVALPSPVLTASGTAGRADELADYLDLAALGAVVVKSLAAFAWPGHPPPRLAPLEAGMLNAVGLQGPGVAAWLAEDLPRLERAGARVVASIWGRTTAEFAEAAEMLSAASAAVVAVEVNVSCPNIEDRARMFAHSPTATAAAVDAARRAGRPVWAKLSPNTADLTAIAAAALEAGAEGLVLVNTLLGLEIDVERRAPVLAAGGGGLSGVALRPVALRAVYDCHAAFPSAPIVGVGGVATGVDAIRLVMAGASAVEVGTATFADPRAPARIQSELAEWCDRHRVRRLADLVGVAHAGARDRMAAVGPQTAASPSE